jgi:transposase InsO family protein
MVAFIDQQRETCGVESICTVLPIAPSTYFRRKAQQRDPARRSARALGDEALKAIIRRVWTEQRQVYGSRKGWTQMGREGLRAACYRVRRLMRDLGLVGAVRGRAWITTTQPDPTAARPADLVDRRFTATRPNQLWVADFTYVATWRGFVYVAFVIDVFSRMIVGWRASNSPRTDLVLDALEQALFSRSETEGVVHHSDRGSQYLSIRYTERLAEAGMERSVGSIGDSYDNALAEAVNGLYKKEVIRRKGPWHNLDHVEFETLTWVAWFNSHRLLEPIGYIPPAEFEAAYYRNQPTLAMAAGVN